MLIAGHRTSVSLEAEFWDTLKRIAGERGLSVNRLIEEIDAARSGNLSSAIRVFVLKALDKQRASGAQGPEAPGPRDC